MALFRFTLVLFLTSLDMGARKILNRNGPARPGPAEISGRSCSILFLSVFLKDFLMKI